jgi:hypothetical protein
MFKVLIRNRDRLKSIWPLVDVHLQRIICTGNPPILIERACINVLNLLLRLTHVVSFL